MRLFITALALLASFSAFGQETNHYEIPVFGDYEWISNNPIDLGDGNIISGFSLNCLNNEYVNENWNAEGVMFVGFTSDEYGRILEDVRMFGSSFDYRISDKSIDIKIKFSAANLEKDALYIINYVILEDGIGLTYKNQKAFYYINQGILKKDLQLENEDLQFSKNAKKLALVIGNANYDKGELKNPVNDALLVAEILDSLDFDVILDTNLTDVRSFIKSIREFGERRSEYDVAFVYYAGHAVQIDGENYLLPTKEVFQSKDDVYFNGVVVNDIMKYLTAQSGSVNIIILDACRNNPFEHQWNPLRSLEGGSGLARIPPPAGSLIAFSTDAGKTASDGSGENSIYCKSLCEHMLLANTSLDQVFRNVRADVMKLSNNIQIPVEESKLIGNTFYFNVTQNIQNTFFNEEVYTNENTYFSDDSLVISSATEKPITGVFKLWHEGGKLDMVGNYLDGKMEGVFKWYYENGKLHYEGSYFNGKLAGGIYTEYTYYTDDEYIRSGVSSNISADIHTIQEMKDGKLHGLFKKYHEGELIIEEYYYQE